jgi:alpha-glucosidase
VRPLALVYQDDPHVADIDDEFLYGDAFLVAPVFEPESTSRRLYIPQGRWYDFWEGTLTAGPQIARLRAPIDRLPLLVRAGSIVSAWPVMQHTSERPVDQLILHVFPGNGQSLLYEDDGHTWAFREGDYRLTRLACETHWATGTTGIQRLKIERFAQGPFAPSYSRIQIVIHGMESHPQNLQIDGEQVTETQFDPRARTVTFEGGLFQRVQAQFSDRQSR